MTVLLQSYHIAGYEPRIVANDALVNTRAHFL